jgi:hypothetical protein
MASGIKPKQIQSKGIEGAKARLMVGLRMVPEGQAAAEEAARLSGLTISSVMEFLTMLGLSEMLKVSGNAEEGEKYFREAMRDERRARLVFKAFGEMAEEFKSPFREAENDNG